MPRAFVVYEAVSVADTDLGTENALQIMRAPDFDPARTVVISADVGSWRVVPSETIVFQSTAAITTYTPERIEIEASAEAEGYLVLSDAYYPGWKASVNGQSQSIYRADVMFRAVQIPAGESTVIFTYEPAWMPWSIVVGILSWGVVSVAVIAIITMKIR